ncbi:uncharacterized protein LOC129216159 [Uloborus diversus]|uniref:uncharacterized protein LOC129216159 n=1 Tax=Uloborus diversus TaxID=327109 RepID=UPI0024099C63|nr:uncharacterized protein LOC129216159 [Uloborus diversus]XP_054706302.1 uncharacterized protein LOC129216159 [Uloborus diversus]
MCAVMEAATLSSPQRRFTVVPVQKSLSLPSYARAGGEGIDHKLIFAALELKEKSRRKSRIFAKEKTARQNLFCLPIPSSAKCRETSLSSDTSCSSLEYQKPKQVSKLKAEEVIVSAPRPSHPPSNDFESSKTKPTRNESDRNPDSVRDEISPKCEDREPGHSLKVNDHHQNLRSPVEYLRPNVGSSDSMERSSRSSTDSLSRKERLTAIKARVEAAREKYGDSSSEEESRAVIARYNSDGVIHRRVRDVKSRSSRMEKGIRRRSQDEWSIRRASRKNLSLCLTSHDDNFLEKSFITNGFNNNFECKTDFCPSPNYPDLSRKNYYSDFPNKENVARVVQARIKQIEDEEKKRKIDLGFRDKNKIVLRQNLQNLENSVCSLSEQMREISPDKNVNHHTNVSKYPANSETIRCPSPIPRSQQAPTPPPRSPKSKTFINKAFIQHQNASRENFENNSLERKGFIQSNIPNTRVYGKSEVNLPETKNTDETLADSLEKRRIRELLNSRRKTCGFFDFSDKVMLNKTNDFIDNTQHLFRECNKISSPVSTLKANENKESGSDSQFSLSEDIQKKLLKNKFSENEQKHEYMFNSLESKKKLNSSLWFKSENSPLKKESCFCHIKPGDNFVCTCNSLKNKDSCKPFSNSLLFGKQGISLNLNHGERTKIELKNPISRLSKSEMNISFTESSKRDIKKDHGGNTCILPLQKSQTCPSAKDVPKMADINDEISATANLESAMEELENVYRSLKFSSDNLSERNSMSQSEDDFRLSKNELCRSEICSKPRSSVKESIFKFDSISKFGNDSKLSCNLNHPKYSNSIKPDPDSKILHTSNTNLSTASVSVPKPFSIDELFNDLTRQLDIEQKQLKESRDNRCPSQFCSNVGKTESSKHLSPLESIVSLRKELYNNLQKSSLKRLNGNENVRKDIEKVDDSNVALARKKYKAVRSLSANISSLMSGENSDSSGRNKPNVPDNSSSYNLQSSLTRESPPKYCSPLNSNKKDYLYVKSPRPYKIPEKKTDTDNFPNQKSDEIRHIRVSMDSNPVISSNTCTDSQEYARLSSAVCGPQSPSKCDFLKRSEMNSPITEPTPKDKMDVLDETGLEKLLNSLLTEVPESNQSSLLFPKDVGPATPPTTSGEMRVLQHLDVIRLKPVPS